MHASDRLTAGHSTAFVATWRAVCCRVYRWRQEGRFAVVPSLCGRPVRSYLPGLDYADLNATEARQLAQQVAGRPHNIRALSVAEGELPAGMPAVLRLDLGAFSHDRTALWKQSLAGSARGRVRRACRDGLRASEETGPAALDAFSALLSSVCARHGVPMRPAALLKALVDGLDARILVVRDCNGAAMASLLWLLDGTLAWVPWIAGTRRAGVGELLYWALLESALNSGADIVDFGRARVGGGVYRFKRKFGAVPVPVLWLSDKPQDLYARYALPQKLYRALPNAVAAAVGPRLCRYLAEY